MKGEGLWIVDTVMMASVFRDVVKLKDGAALFELMRLIQMEGGEKHITMNGFKGLLPGTYASKVKFVKALKECGFLVEVREDVYEIGEKFGIMVRSSDDTKGTFYW